MRNNTKITQAPTHAGFIPARYRVSSDGHGMCSIPVIVPPGTHKLQPRLSFVYASDHENGLMGIGWRLAGLSTITRIGQTMIQDNAWTSVNFTDTDRFALDGQRIMQSALDSESDAFYHTEIESWLKIVPITDNNIEGPAGFIVTSKDGKTMQYGMDAAFTSRIMAVGKNAVRVWALNRVEDQFGNYISISYINDPVNGSYMPDTIEYTGNSNVGTLPQRSVVFGYEERMDTIICYQGGTVKRQANRLKTVSTFLDGKPVLTYTMDYQYGALSGFSQLSNITLSDAKGLTLPATSFEWPQESSSLYQPALQLAAPTGIPYQPVQTFRMDVSGNGLNDLVMIWSDDDNHLAYAILFSDRNGFTNIFMGTPTGLPFYGHAPGLQTVDINGDGRGDLVYFFADDNDNINYASFISDGQQFVVSEPTPVGIKYSQQPLAIPVDINGDGATDIIIPYGENGLLSMYMFISNGKEYVLQPQPVSTAFPIIGSVYGINLIPASVTGNPMQDLIYSYWQDGMMNLVSLISNGSGFTPAALYSYPFINNGDTPARLIPINLNGDNLTDVAISRQTPDALLLDIFISDGIRICAPVPELLSVSIPANNGFLVPMDMTGDGRLDLLHVYPDYNDNMFVLVPYICNGIGFTAAPALPKSFSTLAGSVNSISMDGSGKTGIFYINNPVPGQSGSGWNLQVIKASEGYPGLIQTINNGMGGHLNFSYQSMAVPGVYTESLDGAGKNQVSGLSQLAKLSGMSVAVNNSPGGGHMSFGSIQSRRFVTAPLYVVTTFEKSDGRGNVYSRSYTYEDGKIDTTGRGWLGFKKRSVINTEKNRKTLQEYHQVFPFGPKLKKRTRFRLSDLSYLSTCIYEYLDQQAGVGRIHSALLLSKTENHFTYASSDSTPDYTHVTGYQYGDYGNVSLRSVINSYADGSVNEVYIGYEYYNDTVNHRLGYIRQRKLSSNRHLTKLIALIDYIRYPDTMALQNRNIWVDKDSSIMTDSRTYDDFGNVLTITNVAKDTTTFVFDKTTHHTYPSVVYYPPNNAGKILEFQYSYDLRFGATLSKTDANGFKKYNVLDDLGRIAEKHGPDLNGADFVYTRVTRILDPVAGYCRRTKMAQDWTGNKVKIRQRYFDGLNRAYVHEQFGREGELVTRVMKVTTNLDGDNRSIHQSQPYFDGRAPSFINKSYDPYGNLLSKDQPINTAQSLSASFAYNGNMVTTTRTINETKNKVTQTTRQQFGNKRRIVQYIAGDNSATQLDYDDAGRIKSIDSPGAITENIQYDSANRKTLLGGNAYGEMNYAYDVSSKKIDLTKADGQQITYRYDALGRTLSVEYGDGRILSYSYDDPTSQNGNGRLCSIQLVKNGVMEYRVQLDYYPNGKTSKRTLNIDGQQFITAYTYSPVGLLTLTVFPNGASIQQEYSADGLLETVSFQLNEDEAVTPYIIYSDYTPTLKPRSVVYPVSGIVHTYEYNNLGLISNYVIQQGSTILRSYGYSFDDLARIKEIVYNGNPGNYGYDDAGRLNSVTNAVFPDESYTYDASGNFLTKANNSFTYNDKQITVTDQSDQQTTQYQFNSLGNLSSRQQGNQQMNFEFDALARLSSVTDNSNQPLRSYCYNNRGIRLKTIEHDTNKTIYHIHPCYRHTVQTDGSILQELEIGGPAGLVANLVFSVNGQGSPVLGNVQFLHTDHTRSVVMVTDSSGNLVTSINYHPFGSIYELKGSDVFSKKFGGKEWDSVTGLYYFNARYFDPLLGQFISPDSKPSNKIMEHDVFNRYAYVLNDPINFRDSSGNGPLEWIMFGLGIVLAVGLLLVPGAGEAADAVIVTGDVALEVAAENGIVETLVQGEIGEEADSATLVAGEIGEEADSATDVTGEVGEQAAAADDVLDEQFMENHDDDFEYVEALFNQFMEEFGQHDVEGNPLNMNANNNNNNNDNLLWNMIDQLFEEAEALNRPPQTPPSS